MRLRGGRVILPASPQPIDWQKGPQDSHFFDLPPEIRCMIYRYAISHHQLWIKVLAAKRSRRIGLECFMMFSARRDYPKDQERRFCALLKTCKLISEESLPILYDQTHFSFSFYQEQLAPSDITTLYVCQDLNKHFPTVLLSRVRHLDLTLCSETRGFNDTLSQSITSLVDKTNQGNHLKSLFITVFDSKPQLFQNDDLTLLLEFRKFRGTCVFELPRMTMSSKEVGRLKQLLKDNYGMSADVFLGDDRPVHRATWLNNLRCLC